MFCIEGGCDLSGSVLALKFSKSDVIGDGRCVTERKHFFSAYHGTTYSVFVFFLLLFRS